MDRRLYVVSASIGILAGLAGGLFGVGGGILIVPGLVVLLGLAPHRAHPTSGAAVVLIAVTALTRFASDGSVDWPAAAALFVGAGLGFLIRIFGLGCLVLHLRSLYVDYRGSADARTPGADVLPAE